MINRTLIKKNGNTAYEMFTGKKTSAQHLRRIGCKKHYSVLPRRGKLDRISRRGILLGFEEDFKVYRIYNPEEQKVITSRDVYFNEDIMPYKQSNNGEIISSSFQNKDLDGNKKENINERGTCTTPEEGIDEGRVDSSTTSVENIDEGRENSTSVNLEDASDD